MFLFVCSKQNRLNAFEAVSKFQKGTIAMQKKSTFFSLDRYICTGKI